MCLQCFHCLLNRTVLFVCSLSLCQKCRSGGANVVRIVCHYFYLPTNTCILFMGHSISNAQTCSIVNSLTSLSVKPNCNDFEPCSYIVLYCFWWSVHWSSFIHSFTHSFINSFIPRLYSLCELFFIALYYSIFIAQTLSIVKALCIVSVETFQYMHYGNFTYDVDERAEVGMLSRSILIEGVMEPACYYTNSIEKKLCARFGMDTFGGNIRASDFHFVFRKISDKSSMTCKQHCG